MIIDCHTHIWSDISQLGEGAAAYIRRQGGRDDLQADPASLVASSACVDKALVFGCSIARLGAAVPNDWIAACIAKHNDKLIGVASVDPAADANARATAEGLLSRAEFRGLMVSPAAQAFHPADSRAMELYALAQDRGVPVFFHHGAHHPAGGRMEFARPFLLDEIAREFPRLTMVISAMGFPWIEECVVLLGKHERVFADVGPLIRRPWQAYNSLVLANQFRVMDKILFGSDFPYLSAAEAIAAVYRLHEVTQGTNLPAVPRETLRGMVERDALTALGIARPGETAAKAASKDEEDEL